MAATMYRYRVCLGKLINGCLERRLFSKTYSRTCIAASYASVTTSSHKYSCFEIAPKIQVLIPSKKVPAARFFCTGKKLTTEKITEKVLHVCKTFDKIPTDKLTLDSHFMNDLGLDSLDHVELIMNIEDDFNFEIPDADAEKLLRPKDIVAYIEQKEGSSKQ